mmetsp:Transcript_15467/g.38080  ORF Transcript_15467/g.38080 Transcript_15467/m.38080 type:complete len:234 (+) Transcript_15467:531-1232(+)
MEAAISPQLARITKVPMRNNAMQSSPTSGGSGNPTGNSGLVVSLDALGSLSRILDGCGLSSLPLLSSAPRLQTSRGSSAAMLAADTFAVPEARAGLVRPCDGVVPELLFFSALIIPKRRDDSSAENRSSSSTLFQSESGSSSSNVHPSSPRRAWNRSHSRRLEGFLTSFGWDDGGGGTTAGGGSTAPSPGDAGRARRLWSPPPRASAAGAGAGAAACTSRRRRSWSSCSRSTT